MANTPHHPPHAVHTLDGEGVFEFDRLRTDVGIAVFALEQEARMRQQRHGRRPEVIHFAASRWTATDVVPSLICVDQQAAY